MICPEYLVSESSLNHYEYWPQNWEIWNALTFWLTYDCDTIFIIGIILFTIAFNFFLSFISQVTYIHYVILTSTKAQRLCNFFFVSSLKKPIHREVTLQDYLYSWRVAVPDLKIDCVISHPHPNSPRHTNYHTILQRISLENAVTALVAYDDGMGILWVGDVLSVWSPSLVQYPFTE